MFRLADKWVYQGLVVLYNIIFKTTRPYIAVLVEPVLLFNKHRKPTAKFNAPVVSFCKD